MTEHKIEELISDLGLAFKNHTPFSAVGIGDAEQIFLACPEIETTKHLDEYLKISGVTADMVKLKKEIASLISVNDYVFTHRPENKTCDPRINTPAWDWARFFYMTPEIFKHYGIDGVKAVYNLAGRYKMVTDGSLFNILEGARVLFVGFHAPEVERRMKKPDFVKHYKKMNLHKIKVAGSIGCSEFSNVGNEVYEMVEKAKEFDYDVALLGMGIPSNYFAPMIKKSGKIAIDIGHCMSALAGKGDKQRMHIDNFDYDD